MGAAEPLRVLLGVSGGIAAFKAPLVVRLLRARGHAVRCALTRAAAAFVSPLTLEILSGERVYGEEYLAPGVDGAELHIAAAAWADVLVVAPATAHTLGRLALGLADDFLTTAALAFDGPLVVAPAMHERMWSKPAVASHVATLVARGSVVVGPVVGPLADGGVGMGRMAEPEAIVAAVEAAGERRQGAGDLAGRRILVSAGPTHEPLDPVRYLGNRSSGKMGFAIAAAAARRGAAVTLVAGPVSLPAPAGVERVDVTTALEMQAAIEARVAGCDVVVMAAAVADFRPRRAAAQKLKKEHGVPTVELVPNPDILAGLRDLAPVATLVGFAAETEAVAEGARRKLVAKRLDYLVANDVSRPGIGFGSDLNEVVIHGREGEPVHLGPAAKVEIAERILDVVTARGRGAHAG